MDKRIVITGLGVVSSIGTGKDDFWKALIAGTSGISKISSFDTSGYPTHYGGEVKNFEPGNKNMGRASNLAIASAKLAVVDAGIKLDNLESQETGVVIGTTMGESQVLEKLNDVWVKNGTEAIDPRLIPLYPCNVLSLNVAQELKLAGPNFVIPNACAAGNYAIGYAYDLIRMGKARMMLAGGTDAFSRIAFIGFNRLLAVAPEKCQPFDKNRKGMLVAEGSGMVLIETLEAALKRGANIYAEILGYGLSCDAHHMTAPFNEGIKEAIEKALSESKIPADKVDYFSAHGTGTPANDRQECLAIKKVFGDYSKKLPVSSIKSMLGHTMGAASAIEAVACALSVKNDIIPPTINFQTADPECGIDCVPNVARSMKVDVVLNSASAFGGNNACLALKKFLP
ncbi:MAG: beta-ketoacyl-[acyl-carrier-protein] synthase family protein [Candidatus Omnitrophota bacterium]|jgi:3-oxoacyl-[acyl-carrier-protein] synthase II